MKRGIRTLLSTLLISTLVLTSAATAFADSSNTRVAADVKSEPLKAAEVQKPALKAAVQKQINLNRKGASDPVMGSIPVNTITPTSKVDNYKTGLIAINATDELAAGSYDKGYSQEIKLTKGILDLAAWFVKDESGAYIGDRGTVYFGLYKDKALTQQVDYTSIYESRTLNGRIIQVPKDGTYYLGVKAWFGSSDANKVYAVQVVAAKADGRDRTVTSGKTIAVGQKNAQTNFFKIKASKNGYLMVQSTEGGDKVTLCNSKKKALSGATYTNYVPTYGVKKGAVYYVKVAAYANSNGGYNLKVTNNAIAEKSGSKKAKAVTIKKKATKKGTIVAGENKADWYKFKLTGKKKVIINLDGRTNDNIKAGVYQGGKSKVIQTMNLTTTKGSKLTSIGKWPKGTYYIKVYRGNKNSSGYYTLDWK